MAELFPPLDDALGGLNDAVTGTAETAGDAAGGFLGGVTDPFMDYLAIAALLAVVAGLTVAVVA